MQGEPELVAELRWRLEQDGTSLDEVLDGALTLAALGYPALSRQYTVRVAHGAHRQGRPELLHQALTVLWTAYKRTGRG